MAKRFEKAKAYTEKYKNQLLPCRCCGNTDIRIESERMIFAARDGWSVTCSTHACDCTGVYTKVVDAVKRWNEMQSQDKKEAVK